MHLIRISKSVESKSPRLVWLLLCSLAVASAGFAQDLRQLKDNVPAAAKNQQALGRLSASAALNLAIGFQLRDAAGLTNLLQQIYDPASPKFHKYLTPEQFTEQFSPSQQDYDDVVAFATSHNLTVLSTHPNRMLLEVSGSAADVEKAFGGTLRIYKHPKENRNFYALDAEPVVPSRLKIQDVSGLSDFPKPNPKFKHKPSAIETSPKSGTGPSGNYIGQDFRAAYAPGVALTGAGQVIALVQFDGYLASDISAYATLAGISPVPLQNIYLNGFNGVPTGSGGEVEVSLDIEMVISMAPGLSKVMVYEGSPFNFNPNTVLNRIANDNFARQVSCSWGWSGGPQGTTEQIFLQMAAQGQSFFNASGDDDAFASGQVDDPTFVGSPSSSPNITQVGGTTLTTGAGGAWVSEKVWNWGDGVGSSGGISSYYALPVWQQGISMTLNKGSTSRRNIPDVALTADNVFVIADGGTHYTGVGGTSVAAPLWAGFTALINQQAVNAGIPPLGFLNPAIYTIGKGSIYGSVFHDTTTGDNKWDGSPTLFSAVTGYDLCTGWGTPAGQNLINALTIGGTPDGIMEVIITPPNLTTLLQGSIQPVFVQVYDGLGVTNANVTATVNGGTNVVLVNTGVAPDKIANDSIYSANFSVPNATNPVTLSFSITAPGKTNSTTVVTYNVVPVPTNDYFTNATKIPAAGAEYFSNNKFGTMEPGEPKHAGITTVGGSLWWNWSPSTSTNVFIDTTGSEVDTVLAVYTGSTVSNLIQVAATNDVGVKQQAFLSLNAVAGASYRIAVASVNQSALGAVRLVVAPGGQLDTNPPTLSILSPLSGQWVSNSQVTLTGTAADPQPNASGIKRVTISLNGQNYRADDTTNWSYTVGLKQGLNHIRVSAEDVAGNLSDPVTVDVTYVVVSVANDLFANAIPLAGNSGTVSAITTNATKEFNEPAHAGNAGGKSVWWSFTPGADGLLSLSTTNSTFDTLMAVYTGSSVTALTVQAFNDDSGANSFSALSVAVRSNELYHIAVDGFDGASGVASLSYAFVPGPVYNFTVGADPGGHVSPSSGSAVSNSTVVLTAMPDPFFQFDSWSGAFSSTVNPLSVSVKSNLTLVAHFRKVSFTDDFETGDLLGLNWTTGGNVPWLVQNTNVLSGNFSARSGVIGNRQTSSLIVTTNYSSGTISFYFKVSCEPSFDFLAFYVDGVERQRWSGEMDWTGFSTPLAGGTHTLEWRYSKDQNGSSGLDAAFIDNVNLPFQVQIDGTSAAHLDITRQADGSLLLSVQGQTNQQYVIQGATNLTTPVDWLNLSTNIATDGVIHYVDPGVGSNPIRFYRAFVP